VVLTAYLRECNHDELERRAKDVSDPSSPDYGRYWTAEAIQDFVRCPDHQRSVDAITSWLK
jgi:hypothetical protein